MRRIIVLLVLLAATVLAVVATGGSEFNKPEPTLAEPFDSSAVDFGVDGPDGQPVICKNGKELRVPRALIQGPPSLPPQAKGQPQGPQGAEYVWRCGLGENPHRNPRLVDRAQDPLARP